MCCCKMKLCAVLLTTKNGEGNAPASETIQITLKRSRVNELKQKRGYLFIREQCELTKTELCELVLVN